VTLSDEETEPGPSIDYATHLTPFSADEVARLRRYIARVDELLESEYAAGSTGPIMLHADFTAPGIAENIRFDGPDRKAAQHVVGIFRELYGGRHDTTSGTRIASIIGQHAKARNTPHGDHLAGAIARFRKSLERRTKTDPRMGILIADDTPGAETTSMTPDEVIDLIVNGDLLHFEPAKAAALAEDPMHTQMMWMMLFSTIRDFADMWSRFADEVVRPILATPELVAPS
jgi:hypothetical protein